MVFGGLLEEMLLRESASVENVVKAMDNHAKVIINYHSDGKDEHSGTRVIEPITYGLTKAGNPVIRAYQPYGDTTTTAPGWKMFRLDRKRLFESDTVTTYDSRLFGASRARTYYSRASTPFVIDDNFYFDVEKKFTPEHLVMILCNLEVEILKVKKKVLRSILITIEKRIRVSICTLTIPLMTKVRESLVKVINHRKVMMLTLRNLKEQGPRLNMTALMSMTD